MTVAPTQLNTTIQARIQASIDVKQALLAQSAPLTQVAALLIDAYRQGRKLLIFGNGGSAADAQHIAAEFVGRYYLDRQAIPALALTVNTSSITSIGNDYAFDQIFVREIEAFGQAGDVAIGLSTSGNSPNVIAALRTARERGLHTVGLTGESGGGMRDEAEVCICVPSRDTPRIQEAHMLIGHIWAELVEHALFGAAPASTRE